MKGLQETPFVLWDGLHWIILLQTGLGIGGRITICCITPVLGVWLLAFGPFAWAREVTVEITGTLSTPVDTDFLQQWFSTILVISILTELSA